MRSCILGFAFIAFCILFLWLVYLPIDAWRDFRGRAKGNSASVTAPADVKIPQEIQRILLAMKEDDNQPNPFPLSINTVERLSAEEEDIGRALGNERIHPGKAVYLYSYDHLILVSNWLNTHELDGLRDTIRNLSSAPPTERQLLLESLRTNGDVVWFANAARGDVRQQ